jgi:capsular polysaccharide biosynthesis protein
MEFKEMIKILKNDFKTLIFFAMIGGLIAAGIVLSQPVRHKGDFVIYLNKAAPSKEAMQNYNSFYALESLSQVADFLVEWSKKFGVDQSDFELKLKKKTATFLEGSIMSSNAETTKRFFDGFVDSATQHILYFNDGIFSDSKITVSFSDFKNSEIKINFWRYFFAGIFGGLMIGIFMVFLRRYFGS